MVHRELSGVEQVVFPELSGVERQVVSRAFLQVLDPSLVIGPESIEEGAELGLSTFVAAGGLDLAPGLSKKGIVFQAQMALGIAQQMHGAQLMIGVIPFHYLL